MIGQKKKKTKLILLGGEKDEFDYPASLMWSKSRRK